jgi:hypothetical protein
MSAALALNSAYAVGIRVRIDGEDLELEAPAQPPQAVLDLLSLHKADILRLLRPANDAWLPEDWRVFFDERAAILEFDAGLPRAEAEARAVAYCVTEWINRNPTPSAPGRCLACGGGERPCDPLLPFGIETTGHAWVHRACWPAWCRASEFEAIAALTSMDIRTSGSCHEHTCFTRGEGNERDTANDAA